MFLSYRFAALAPILAAQVVVASPIPAQDDALASNSTVNPVAIDQLLTGFVAAEPHWTNLGLNKPRAKTAHADGDFSISADFDVPIEPVWPEPEIHCTPNLNAKQPAKIDADKVFWDLRWIYRNTTEGEDAPVLYGRAEPGGCTKLACFFGIYIEVCNKSPDVAIHVTPRQVNGAVNILKEHCLTHGEVSQGNEGFSHNWGFTNGHNIGNMGGIVIGRNNWSDYGWSLETKALGGSHCWPHAQPHNNKFYHTECAYPNMGKWTCMGPYNTWFKDYSGPGPIGKTTE